MKSFQVTFVSFLSQETVNLKQINPIRYMKKISTVVFSFLLVTLLSLSGSAQGLDGLLDQAMSMQSKGDNKGLANALSGISSGLEKEANDNGGDFKDKLLGQVGGLKKMIPLASKGMVKEGPLKKIINTIKLALGANRISNMLGGGGSLIGKAAGLKSSLGLMSAGSSILGGGQADKLGGLISGAMGNVDKLDGNKMAAKAAEPALKNQLGGILSMVKGAI